MDDPFDPYYKWLGIPSEEQPANWYRLLGLRAFEDDRDVIVNAADQRMGHVRTFQTGPHGEISQRILNELSRAKLTLLNPQKRADYDRDLRETNPTPASPAPDWPPVPAARTIRSDGGLGQLARQGLQLLVGGLGGLVVAYVLVCYLRPDADFLDLWPQRRATYLQELPTESDTQDNTPDNTAGEKPPRNSESATADVIEKPLPPKTSSNNVVTPEVPPTNVATTPKPAPPEPPDSEEDIFDAPPPRTVAAAPSSRTSPTVAVPTPSSPTELFGELPPSVAVPPIMLSLDEAASVTVVTLAKLPKPEWVYLEIVDLDSLPVPAKLATGGAVPLGKETQIDLPDVTGAAIRVEFARHKQGVSLRVSPIYKPDATQFDLTNKRIRAAKTDVPRDLAEVKRQLAILEPQLEPLTEQIAVLNQRRPRDPAQAAQIRTQITMLTNRARPLQQRIGQFKERVAALETANERMPGLEKLAAALHQRAQIRFRVVARAGETEAELARTEKPAR